MSVCNTDMDGQMKKLVFGFLVFDLLVLLIIQNFGPITINAGSAVVVVAFPWQKTEPHFQVTNDELHPIRTPAPTPPAIAAEPSPAALTPSATTASPAAGSAFKCKDAQNRISFSDKPCSSQQLKMVGVIDGSKLSRADPIKITPSASDIDQTPTVSAVSHDTQEAQCADWRQKRNQAEAARNQKVMGEYQYLLIKHDCSKSSS